MRTTFWVEGVPVPQPRVKSRVLPPDSYGQVRSTVYTPQAKIGPWKTLVSLRARMHKPLVPLTGPVRIDLDFFLPRPKYLCRARDPQGALYCFMRGTGDFDNLAKGTIDVLQDIGWLTDDAQVCDSHITKFYHAVGGVPGVQISIEKLEQVPGFIRGEIVDAPGQGTFSLK